MKTIKAYYRLSKPGIIYGNVLTIVAGFLFGSYGSIHWVLFLGAVVGLSLVMASACVFNNYLDRGIDSKMERTKTRALITGEISGRSAIIFGIVLLAVGTYILWRYTNPLALAIGLIGFVVYVALYTPLKPITPYAVYVGAVAGAVPILVGYTAASAMFDTAAFYLFAFMFVWQIPHFLAIAKYRYAEYSAAGVPLLIRAPKNDAEAKLARKIFLLSLIVLLVFCIILGALHFLR